MKSLQSLTFLTIALTTSLCLEQSSDKCFSSHFSNTETFYCDQDKSTLSESDEIKLNKLLAEGYNPSCSSLKHCGCGFKTFFIVLSDKKLVEHWDSLDAQARLFRRSLTSSNCFLVAVFNKTSPQVGLDHSHEANEFLSYECYRPLREPLDRRTPLKETLFEKAQLYKRLLNKCYAKTLIAEVSLKRKIVIPLVTVLSIVCVVVISIGVSKCCQTSPFRPVSTGLPS